jgi:hypothetical protein
MAEDEATTLGDVLRPGETVLWTGRPSLRTTGLTSQQLSVTGFQLFIVAMMAWNGWTRGMPEVTWTFVGVVLVALVAQLAIVPVLTRRRLSRTTYHLTDRRAIVADGKTVATMGLGASPLLKYAAGGRRVTATFGPTGPRARFELLRPPPKDVLDFTNVTDVEGFVAALDHLARGAEPKQLRPDWEGYETGGPTSNSTQHLPYQSHT